AGGFGARQRRSPTGGNANGIPLKAEIAGSEPGTPETRPYTVFTGWVRAAASGKEQAIVKIREQIGLFISIPPFSCASRATLTNYTFGNTVRERASVNSP